MANKNQQNINIVNSSDVALGNIQMTTGSDNNQARDALTQVDTPFTMELKKMVGEDKLKEVIEAILQNLKNQGSDAVINKTIMQAASLTQLDLQVNINVITHEQAKIDRAKISDALLKIIDDDINK